VSWRKIKAEYIAGGISQRKIAEKYGVPFGTLQRRARVEKWNAKRQKAEDRTVEKITQKTADEVADNAVMLQRIKAKLLRKLDGMIDAYPDRNVAEMRQNENGTILIYRMKDIAAVYAALEDKTVKASVDIEDLTPLTELLRDD
jgi:transposase-like protein